MNNTKKITIQDVAKYANVSTGTIDRVIHDRGKVSPDKKKKIEDAIEKLNFNPNLLASTLALGKSFHICALLPSAPHLGHYWSIPKIGIDRAAIMYKDFGVVTNSFYYNESDEASFTEQTNKILELNPSGVILVPLFLQESIIFVEKLRERKIPYVFIDTDIPNQESLAYIGPDIERSAYIAGKLLCSVLKENSNILILNLVKGVENASALNRMEKGFLNFFQENELNNKINIHTLTINSTDKEIIFRELTKYYLKNNEIKGVFVTNSKAHMVSDFHLKHELDIKVVGFDLVKANIEHLKLGGIDYLISQSPMQQGLKAVQVLFDLFIHKNIPLKVQHVPLDIIIKENVDFYVDFS